MTSSSSRHVEFIAPWLWRVEPGKLNSPLRRFHVGDTLTLPRGAFAAARKAGVIRVLPKPAAGDGV